MKKISERVLYEGQWLGLKESIYKNADGEMIRWESVTRKNTTVGMVVVARLMPSKRFVLIKQYRIAIEGYILGFPAGLAQDDFEQALIELKQETGYVGEIVEVSPILRSNSGIINDRGRVVMVEVDETLPENQNPQQELEPEEDIEVFLVSKAEAEDFLKTEQAKGTHVGSGLWYLFGTKDWFF